MVCTESLNAREVSRTDALGAPRIVVDLAGLKLFIEQVPGDTVRPPNPPFLGIEHIGFGVNELDAAAADLRGRGVRFVAEPKQFRPGVRIASVEAPDGVLIELIERSGN